MFRISEKISRREETRHGELFVSLSSCKGKGYIHFEGVAWNGRHLDHERCENLLDGFHQTESFK